MTALERAEQASSKVRVEYTGPRDDDERSFGTPKEVG
jgi:hypothetical protein